MSRAYQIVIRDDDGEYQVWLDAGTDLEPACNSQILGLGPTRTDALQRAKEELELALTSVNKALVRHFEVLP
jgi:hypothetical protein